MDISTQKIHGQSPALLEVLRSADLVAATGVSVLVTGETGTGKELLARTIHNNGLRKNKPFITINCAALPTGLAESALFGHKKGAFTEATELNPGYIAQASGGTLFLDEIAELPLSIQAKLLRFLETGESQRLGDSVIHKHDVRIIAASNRDLNSLVASGDFRQDLFYRLNIVPLELPPLRKRLGDFSILLNAFFQELVRQYKITPPSLSKSALNRLQQYPWPGNVRELHNFCERMLILMPGQTIEVTNLPNEILHYQKPKKDKPFNLPASGIDLNTLEVDLIEQALENAHGNKTHAARLLGLTRDTLLYRMKKYMIQG